MIVQVQQRGTPAPEEPRAPRPDVGPSGGWAARCYCRQSAPVTGKAGIDMLTHTKSMPIYPADTVIDHLFPPYIEEKVQELHEWFEY
ncbi:hypothetical protein [Streptomyces sp. NPDC051364]|uniref:hypothetical protein n=1 Tax=Streptomyces sp. NPDC051364 TaxID=3155799 RepID=UPI003420D8DC